MKLKRNLNFNILFGILLALYAVILNPLYSYFNSDILLSDSVETFLLYHILTYFSYLFFWGYFAYLLTQNYDDIKSVIPMFSFFGYSVVIHSISMLANCLILSFESFSLYTLLLNIFFDLFLSAIAYLVYRLLQNKTEIIQIIFLSLIPTIFHTVNRIIYDIIYGAPSDFSEILIMIVYYLSDFVFFAIGVLLLKFIVKKSSPIETE